jgi:hypothetical protein
MHRPLLFFLTIVRLLGKRYLQVDIASCQFRLKTDLAIASFDDMIDELKIAVSNLKQELEIPEPPNRSTWPLGNARSRQTRYQCGDVLSA